MRWSPGLPIRSQWIGCCEEAARLLCAGTLSVGEVAYRVGFADQSYLTRHFKSRYHLTPKAYLDQNDSRRKSF
jgi:AraC family transcriptional regulator